MMKFNPKQFAQVLAPDTGVRALADMLAEQERHAMRALIDALAEPVPVTRLIAEAIEGEQIDMARAQGRNLMHEMPPILPLSSVHRPTSTAHDEARLARRIAAEVTRQLLPHQSEPPTSATPTALPGAAPAAPSASPAARPEAVTVPAEPVAADEVETPEARQDRRLSWLRAREGDFVPHGDGWKVTGPAGLLAQLVRLERGKQQATKEGVRQDLMKAVRREKARRGRVSR